jgi:ring-1,2-phenylacetyl-CoA epoxidase subunit PaaD
MNRIEYDIRAMLQANGFTHVKITIILSPAWTTDWMSEEGKRKLKAYGIAPPHPTSSVCDVRLFQEGQAVQCPQCNSYSTRLVSQFGSTACKALYKCNACQEPFDYFKCH